MDKTIKIIDLLNKIANREEVPMVRFKGENEIYKYDKEDEMFIDLNDRGICKCDFYVGELNDTVEIIEYREYIEYNVEILENFLKEMEEVHDKTLINNRKEREALRLILDNYKKLKGE
jgi:hypothetical protein